MPTFTLALLVGLEMVVSSLSCLFSCASQLIFHHSTFLKKISVHRKGLFSKCVAVAYALHHIAAHYFTAEDKCAVNSRLNGIYCTATQGLVKFTEYFLELMKNKTTTEAR